METELRTPGLVACACLRQPYFCNLHRLTAETSASNSQKSNYRSIAEEPRDTHSTGYLRKEKDREKEKRSTQTELRAGKRVKNALNGFRCFGLLLKAFDIESKKFRKLI